MTESEAFQLLGIEKGSSKSVIRGAWRTLSTVHHPDAGGSNDAMVRLNLALEMALSWSDVVDSSAKERTDVAADVFPVGNAPRMTRDASSFTVNVLPVECWMALEVVAATCGPTIQDDPPYLLEFLLHDSSLPASRNAWCRCECVPEAGATTVHLTVGATRGLEIPSLEEVRDYLVEQFNLIDWPT